MKVDLNKYSDRELLLINSLRKFLVSASIPREINKKLERIGEKLKQANEALEKSTAQCNQLMITAQALAITAKNNEIEVISLKNELKNATNIINDLRSDLRNTTDKISELAHDSYSILFKWFFSQKTISFLKEFLWMIKL